MEPPHLNKISDSIKEKREKFRVEIKKEKNNGLFNSKRMKFTKPQPKIQLEENKNLDSPPQKTQISDLNFIQEIKDAFKNKNMKILLEKIKIVRMNFSIEPLNFEEFMASGLTPILIAICGSKELIDESELIFESLWIISNGLSGNSNNTRIFIEEGVVEVLIQQINSENLIIREQALWCLVNIAGDSDDEIKKILMAKKVLELVSDVSTTFPLSEEFIENLSSFIVNITNDENFVTFKEVEIFLNVVLYLLTTHLSNDEIISELIRGTYNICLIAQSNNDYLAQIVEIYFGLINLIINEIIPNYKTNKVILFYCIKTVASLFTGYDSTVEELLKNDYVVILWKNFLSDSDSRVRKEIMWGFSNLSCCPSEITQKLFEVPNLIESILEATHYDEAPEVRKEGLICVKNLCATSNQDQLECLVKNGCIDVICSFLDEDISSVLLSHIVDALDSLLYHGREIQQEKNIGENPYGVYLEEKRYLEKLESIINKNNSISNDLILRIDELIHKILRV